MRSKIFERAISTPVSARSRKARPAMSNLWDTCLRLQQPHTSDEAPVLDGEALVARGVYAIAPLVIRALQEKVVPLIRALEKRRVLDWYFFLIHDRTSGVPTTVDDSGEYVHLRLVLKKAVTEVDVRQFLPAEWEKLWAAENGDSFGGVDPRTIVGGVGAARRLIGYQSEFVLRLVEAHRADADSLATIKQVRQYLHFFSNMLQIKVVG